MVEDMSAFEKKLIVPNSGTEEASGYSIPDPPTADEEDEPEQWSACFIIAIDKNGVAHAAADIEGFVKNKVFARGATMNDMALGTMAVSRDLDHISIASRVMINMQSAGEALMRQQEAQRIAHQIGQEPNPFTKKR